MTLVSIVFFLNQLFQTIRKQININIKEVKVKLGSSLTPCGRPKITYILHIKAKGSWPLSYREFRRGFTIYRTWDLAI